MFTETVQYKSVGDVTLNVHVFGAEEGKDRPAVIFFFCGGWNGFNADKFKHHSEYLAGRGMVCFNAEVRVREKHGTTPAECVIDGRSAMRWVRTNAPRYGVDPCRIAASGGSAAGHVSACVALVEGFDDERDDLSVSCRPDALVLFNPVLVVYDVERRVEMFGGEERAKALSPILSVGEGAPPCIVMHGLADETVSADEAVRFSEAMEKAGNRCDLRLYEGEGHGFFNWFEGDNRMFFETLTEMDLFLQSLGWLKGDSYVDRFDFSKDE